MVFRCFSCECKRPTAEDAEITAEKSETYAKAGEEEVVTLRSSPAQAPVGTPGPAAGPPEEPEREGSPKTGKSGLTDFSLAACFGSNRQDPPDAVPATEPPPVPQTRGSTHEEAGLPQNVSDVLTEADRLRLEGWPFAAEMELYRLITRLQQEEDQEFLIEKIKETQSYMDLVAVLTEVNTMLEVLLDDQGWALQKSADNVHVWTRPEKGTDILTVRIAGLVEGPFEHFCSIGKEVALIKTWMPGVKTSCLLKQINTFDQVGYYVWKFPLVSAREFLVEDSNYINDEQGYCVVKRSPPLPQKDLEIPSVQKNTIRAAISNWCSFSAPVGENRIFCVTVMNVDLRIPLPNRLVNYLSISMGFQTFKDLRKNVQKSTDPKSELYKSVADPGNADFYGRMRQLRKAGEAKVHPCQKEILATGWVKDPTERRKLFARTENVLVPMKS
mmetsp:Transcript_10791/g.20031  ORF Transcript_10791/g.20031 Transcript_10791/m.20031 type:complete len:443 (+) Transcript_10791:137-1465(+)